MSAQIYVILAAILAVSHASIIAAPPSAKIIQGPSSSSTIIGADGSSISSVSPGGRIIAEENPSVVAYTAPFLRTPSVATYNAPLISRASYNLVPRWAAYGAPTAYSNAILSEKFLDTVVAGPSGTIATSKTYSKPAFAGEYIAPYANSILYI